MEKEELEKLLELLTKFLVMRSKTIEYSIFLLIGEIDKELAKK